MMRTPGAVALAMLLTVAGCKVVGDDYARPVVDVPGAFRGPAAAGDPLGEADWRQVFTDTQLRRQPSLWCAQSACRRHHWG